MKLSGLLRAALADPALARARDLAKAGRTEDAREGIMAFVQKRPAQFKGK